MRLISFVVFSFLASASFAVAADPVPDKDVTDNIRVRVVAARIAAVRSGLGNTQLLVRLLGVDDPKKEVIVFMFPTAAAATHETTLANIIRSATPDKDALGWQDVTFEIILSVPKDITPGRVKDCSLWYVVSIKPLATS